MTGARSNVVRIERAQDENKKERTEGYWGGGGLEGRMKNGQSDHSQHTYSRH